ncbi:TPA: 3-isopropylmalate dehydrogenase [Streptococcus suis]
MWIRDNQQGISKSVFKERYPFLADHLLDRSLESLAKEQGLFLFPTSWQEIPDLDKSEKLFETVDHSLRTGNVIGFIGYQNDQLTIHSRFAQSDKEDYFLHYMLQKVLHLNVTNLETSFSLEQQFYQLFICLFPSFLQAALRKGLYKEYRRFHHHDANLKGALDIARQLKTSTPFEGKMAYSTREFSFDNNLMQLVRHTIEYIKGHQLSRTSLLFQDKDRENIETIIQATPRYQLADKTKIIYQNQVAPVRHAYYHEYGTLQKLCLLILKGTRHCVGERQQQKIQGILFDVAWLWEEYLAQLLGEEFHHPRNKAKSDSFSMFQGGNGRIYPDFVSLSKKVVADAKYKPIDNIKGRDYLQLVAYMYRFDARKGFYLFPHSGKTEESKQYELLEGKGQRRNEPVVVEKLGLTIPQGVASFDEFCQQIERNEQVFLQSLLSKSRGEISEVMEAK